MRRPAPRYSNISTATTTVLRGAAGDTKAGILYAIVVNNPGATATVTVHDNNAGSGPTIAVVGGLVGPVTLEYGVQFTNGLTVVTAGGTPANITVLYE